jgi:maltooligosyltrehalose trehalohydrolase
MWRSNLSSSNEDRSDRGNIDSMKWTHGAWLEPNGARFRLWAPTQRQVKLVLEQRCVVALMEPKHGGFFEVFVPGATAGALYRFELDDGARVPDPASRRQPQDVHGPSELINLSQYDWRSRWNNIAWLDAVLSEMHVGAFTAEGTFAAAARKLEHLADLGVTAIETMPVADFSRPARLGLRRRLRLRPGFFLRQARGFHGLHRCRA